MKKHLLKLSTFASMPLVSLAAISCSNNQNIPPRDYEMINNETGLAFNSEGEIIKYYYFSDNGNSYENIVIPEYLENNRILTSQYYGYKQKITMIYDNVFSAETKYNVNTGKYEPKYNDYAQYLTSIALPNSIETIGAEAFYGTPLTQIVLPDSVVDIGFGAFKYCTNLTSITLLSKKIKYIGVNAFYYSGLKGSLYIPDSVIQIGSGAFDGTQITEVSIPRTCSYDETDSFPKGCNVIIRG